MNTIFEPPTNLFKNLETLLELTSRDWGADKADSWLYGVICGWHDDPEEGTDGDEILREVGSRHRWSPQRQQELKALHASWLEAKEVMGRPDPPVPAGLDPVLEDLERRANGIKAKNSSSLNGMVSQGRAEGYLEAVRLIRQALAAST